MTTDKIKRSLSLSLFITILTCIFCILYLDLQLAEFFHNKAADEWQQIFKYFSALGHGTFWFALSVTAIITSLLRKKCKQPSSQKILHAGIFALISLIVSGLAARILKLGFGRWRPKFYFEENLYEFAPFTFEFYDTASFPSGHAQTIFTAMTVLWFIYPRLGWIYLTIGALVAFSRVVLVEHYLSDVVAGAYIGFVFTWVTYRKTRLLLNIA